MVEFVQIYGCGCMKNRSNLTVSDLQAHWLLAVDCCASCGNGRRPEPALVGEESLTDRQVNRSQVCRHYRHNTHVRQRGRPKLQIQHQLHRFLSTLRQAIDIKNSSVTESLYKIG